MFVVSGHTFDRDDIVLLILMLKNDVSVSIKYDGSYIILADASILIMDAT